MNRKLNKIFDKLFLIPRSITGLGYRRSLNILSKYIPFKKLNYFSGKKVFDWTVPKEWVIKEAYIEEIKLKKSRPKERAKSKIIDFKKNYLHVVNYSHSINRIMSLKKLNQHLYSIKKFPKLFLTSLLTIKKILVFA